MYDDVLISECMKELLNVEIYQRIKEGMNIKAFNTAKEHPMSISEEIRTKEMNYDFSRVVMKGHMNETNISKDFEKQHYYNFYGDNARKIIDNRSNYIKLVGRKGIEKVGRKYRFCVNVSHFVYL